MLHKFLEPGDWFAPKRYGLGAGLPIAWQGWALLASYLLALTGIGLMAKSPVGLVRITAFLLFLLFTGALIEIARRRTRAAGGGAGGRTDIILPSLSRALLYLTYPHP